MARRIAPRLLQDVMSSRANRRESSSASSPSYLLRIFRHDRARLRPSLAELWAEHVEDIMRRRVVTVGPRDSVTTAIDHMLASKLRSLPVVERRGGKDVLIGIVSRGDVRSLIFENNKAP